MVGTSRNKQVRAVLWIEGSANAVIAGVKTYVGVATGSNAILSDALHSLVDVVNNALSLVMIRISEAPPDRGHPYGHRKFESLAVFSLAVLLTVVAFEIALRTLTRPSEEIVADQTTLALMGCVLAANLALTLWEHRCARRLDSTLLWADARHTLGDVLTTVAVILGWLVASLGFAWVDTVLTFAVSAVVFHLAFGLFRQAIPVLVDASVFDPRELAGEASHVAGVKSVLRVRSRNDGAATTADIVIAVDSNLSTFDSHCIADAVEKQLKTAHGIDDVVVHVEPASAPH